MDAIQQYLPLLIPIIIIQFILIAVALWDLLKRPKTRGPKWVWLVLILLVQWVGPIAYFVFGREGE